MTARNINTPTGLLSLITFIPLTLATLACGGLHEGRSNQLKTSETSSTREGVVEQGSLQTGSVLSSERRLVWAEEFNGPEVDRSHWNYEVNGDGGGNNELQFYTDLPGNSFIEDGVLVIRAQKENYQGRQYTSARMTTRKKFDFTYGRVDVRARLPFGKGVWPAIWMIPTDSVYGGWPMSGEIDIMEQLGQDPNRIYGTLHYGDAWPNHKHTGNSFTLPQGDFSQDFHVFSIEWEPNQIKWFVDGQLFSTKTPQDLDLCKDGQPCPWRFDQDFFFILNVAVGGNWPGYPDASTVFPQTMKVDYVRVYQNSDS